GDLEALHERALHVALGDQWIDHLAGVVAVDHARDPELAGPGVDLDLDEAGADALGQGAALRDVFYLTMHPQGLALEQVLGGDGFARVGFGADDTVLEIERRRVYAEFLCG